MVLADNGSSLLHERRARPGWNDSDLNALQSGSRLGVRGGRRVEPEGLEHVVCRRRVAATATASAAASTAPRSSWSSNGGFETSLAGWKWGNSRTTVRVYVRRRSRRLVLGGARSHPDGRRDPRRLDEHRRLDDSRRDLHRVGLGARAGRTHGHAAAARAQRRDRRFARAWSRSPETAPGGSSRCRAAPLQEARRSASRSWRRSSRARRLRSTTCRSSPPSAEGEARVAAGVRRRGESARSAPCPRPRPRPSRSAHAG